MRDNFVRKRSDVYALVSQVGHSFYWRGAHSVYGGQNGDCNKCCFLLAVMFIYSD